MIFTDENLKSLEKETDDIFVYEIRQIHIKALIARLKAAEKVILGASHDDNMDYPERSCKACRNMETWRKVAGK